MNVKVRKKGNLAVRDLGFESKRSFVEALRVERELFNAALNLCENCDPYERWYEQKRSGGQRLIENPIPVLKKVQKHLNRLLQRLLLPNVFHGSYSCTSILSNAKPHSNVSWYLTFDLANYYKTIRPEKVYGSLRSLAAAPDVARLITRLTTISGRVPQGAPTSPIIAAIAMIRLARRITSLCLRLNAVATIYGDNVCISGPSVIASHQRTFMRIVQTEGFRVRATKTRLVSPSEDKPLPGLIVRQGRPTVADEDFETVNATTKRCVALGESGLAQHVCCRYASHLRGVVNHYAWIDRTAVAEPLEYFERIDWPDEYNREPCWSPKCHCSVPPSGVSLGTLLCA